MGVVLHTSNLSPQNVKLEDKEFKASLGDTVSFRSVWALNSYLKNQIGAGVMA